MNCLTQKIEFNLFRTDKALNLVVRVNVTGIWLLSRNVIKSKYFLLLTGIELYLRLRIIYKDILSIG